MKIKLFLIFIIVSIIFSGCVPALPVNISENSAEIIPGIIYYKNENIYQNGLFNPAPADLKFTVIENSLILFDESGEKEIKPIEWGWKDFPFSDDEWAAFFDIPEEKIDLSTYGKISYQPLSESGFMLLVNGKIWFVRLFPYGPEENPWLITEIFIISPEK